MNALIDPTTPGTHITSWTWDKQRFVANFSPYQNSARVCDVCELPFDVAPPLFWVPCESNVLADQFYFDVPAQAIRQVENAPLPNPPVIPVTET